MCEDAVALAQRGTTKADPLFLTLNLRGAESKKLTSALKVQFVTSLCSLLKKAKLAGLSMWQEVWK